MLDAAIRRLIDAPLNRAGRSLARRGYKADQVTIAGFVIGLGAAFTIAAGPLLLGLGLILLNRLADGLDGAVARASVRTDRGGFLDIALDFVFYAAVPTAFAVRDPANNAVAATILLASFLANGGAFLAYAVLAERRGLATTSQGAKSIYYLAGLAEGSETIAVFVVFCLVPAAFPWLAVSFAALCIASAIGRLLLGWRTLK